MEVTTRQSIQQHGEIVDGSQKVIIHGNYTANKRLDISVEILDPTYVAANFSAVTTAVREYINTLFAAAAEAGIPVAQPSE